MLDTFLTVTYVLRTRRDKLTEKDMQARGPLRGKRRGGDQYDSNGDESGKDESGEDDSGKDDSSEGDSDEEYSDDSNAPDRRNAMSASRSAPSNTKR